MFFKSMADRGLPLAVLLLLTAPANAAVFQGAGAGVFSNPAGPGGMFTAGAGTSNFSWGIPTGLTASSMSYTGQSFDVDENDNFVFGTLSYTNGSIFGGSEANAVNLNVNLNFSAPSPTTHAFTFNLGLINTNNSSDPESSADYVNFDNTVPSQFFGANGKQYTLEFLGFGTLTGSGFTVQDSFRVLEDGSATVNLVGRITSTPGTVETPVPGAVWLFGTGMAALLGLRRKSRI